MPITGGRTTAGENRRFAPQVGVICPFNPQEPSAIPTQEAENLCAPDIVPIDRPKPLADHGAPKRVWNLFEIPKIQAKPNQGQSMGHQGAVQS
ncbi:hypothetical protein N7470_009735 [Penicillium chermesinum]|nr:hypothetical protein N7470_009735 [Penicillium chermesinum]